MKKVFFVAILFLLTGCSQTNITTTNQPLPLFHPTDLKAACALATHYLSFREHIDNATIEKSVACVERLDMPSSKTLWAVALQPTPAYPQYAQYQASGNPFSAQFVPTYVVDKQNGFLMDPSHPGKLYVEENAHFREVTEDERLKLLEQTNAAPPNTATPSKALPTTTTAATRPSMPAKRNTYHDPQGQFTIDYPTNFHYFNKYRPNNGQVYFDSSTPNFIWFTHQSIQKPAGEFAGITFSVSTTLPEEQYTLMDRCSKEILQSKELPFTVAKYTCEDMGESTYYTWRIDQNNYSLATVFGNEYTDPVAYWMLWTFKPLNIQTLGTKITIYEPPLYLPPTKIAGVCGTASLADLGRLQAWRCISGNLIHDPCFETAKPDIVLCNPNPITHELGIPLKLSEPLPPPESFPRPNNMPWIVQLHDGSVCELITGTGIDADGQSFNYGCTGIADTIGEIQVGKQWVTKEVVLNVTPQGVATIKSAVTTTIDAVWK